MPTIKVLEMRKFKEMTRKQLAKKSGVSYSYLGEIERGEKSPTINIICDLAKALKCETEDLYSCESPIDKSEF